MGEPVRKLLPEVLVGERGDGRLDGVTAGDLGEGKVGDRLQAPPAVPHVPQACCPRTTERTLEKH